MADSIACYDSLMGCLNPKLGLKFYIEVQDCPVAVRGGTCDLSMACLWPGFSLDLDSLRDGSRTVLYPDCGMFMRPVIVVCVDCFVGISYATIGLENQVGLACF